MNKFSNFKKHWEDLGKPTLECARIGQSNWQEILTNTGDFCAEYVYRFKGDRHWRLRQKWINSDFTLKIEKLSPSNTMWLSIPDPTFNNDCTYRIGSMKEVDINETKDPGKHYRFIYRDIKLDPARICDIYKISSMCLQFIVKKSLVCGGRGNKDKRQDLLDIINAAQRELEMMKEDKEL